MYVVHSHMSLFYRQPGLHGMKYPPSIAIPEYKPSDRPVGSQAPKHTVPNSVQYMGNTFPHICRFWYIMHEVSLLYYSDGEQSWGASGSPAFAEFKYRELLAWSRTLPARVPEKYYIPHHVQILQ